MASPWSRERLLQRRDHYLYHSLSTATHLAYDSSLRSYCHFCQTHGLSSEPTPETLSLYVTFCASFVRPSTLQSYLSGICSRLEAEYPSVRQARVSPVILRTLAGIKCVHGTAVHRSSPLTVSDLLVVVRHSFRQSDYDSLLFTTLLLVGFDQLLRLAELCVLSSTARWDSRRLMLRCKVSLAADAISLFLPGHKADRFFAGSELLITRSTRATSPFPFLLRYLAARDRQFPAKAALWVRKDGSLPTRQWFLLRLRQFFPRHVTGHSMRRGGAAALAAQGVPFDRIRQLGRWSSDAFEAYVRRHALGLPGGVSAFL